MTVPWIEIQQLKQIVTGTRPHRLVRVAAEELSAYVKALFGRRPPIRPAVATRGLQGMTVKLAVNRRELSDQGYALRPLDNNCLLIEGGSPIAVLWAVYDLAERWGVRYELHGDIMPEVPGSLRLPAADIVCEPDLPLRSFRTYNAFSNNECCWAAADYELLINQLSKMRFNGISFYQRPYDPIADLHFRGVRKSLAAPNFGWEPKIRSDHPGYELFVASGDAARGVFVNPELYGKGSYDATIKAGQAYARKVFRMAHRRGMQCTLTVMVAEFDPAIRKRLLELTAPRHKAEPAPVHRIRYGIWREGGDVETGRCMSVRNPVFMELLAANIQAHIDAFPDADVIYLASAEFGSNDADAERAWKARDKKYDLSSVASLAAVCLEAREKAESDSDRAEMSMRSDLVLLFALDKLLDEHGFDLSRSRRNLALIPGALAPELHRFLPSIFPRGSQFWAAFGYMPSYVATRTDCLVHDDPGAIRYNLTISTEDDNIGLLPQLPGPSVHKIVNVLRQVGAGFQTRQWQHSNLLPTLHYLSHAAWEKGWTPEKAYSHLYAPICGSRAAPHVLRAFKQLERITKDLHETCFCVSFPIPSWIVNLWHYGADTHTPKRLTQLGRSVASVADELAKAIAVSDVAGRDMLLAFERHVQHGAYYLRSLASLIAAKDADQAIQALQERLRTDVEGLYRSSYFDEYDKLSTTRAAMLADAETLMRRACEVFAQGVRDRCDLGALAVLNDYNLDVVVALARKARAEDEQFACREL